MRVITEIKIPDADSYGKASFDSYVAPCRENSEAVVLAAIEAISGLKNLKPGAEITIRIEEDWNAS